MYNTTSIATAAAAAAAATTTSIFDFCLAGLLRIVGVGIFTCQMPSCPPSNSITSLKDVTFTCFCCHICCLLFKDYVIC